MFRSNFVDTCSRFAFVEYESRRDADDAYHEMHNKRIGHDDVLKIEVRGPILTILWLLLTLPSGLVLLRLPRGDLIRAKNVNALQRDVALLAEVDALLLLDEAVATTLLARSLGEIVTETMIDETEVIETVLEARMIGQLIPFKFSCVQTHKMCRDRDVKEERDEGRDRDRERENGANGDERKGNEIPKPLFYNRH
jgi:hypothetical protein